MNKEKLESPHVVSYEERVDRMLRVARLGNAKRVCRSHVEIERVEAEIRELISTEANEGNEA